MDAEQRILATLDRMGRDIRSVRKGQQALFTFVDSLVKTLLTCIPEPSGDTYSQAVARGKSRYDRFLKSVGAGMAGDFLADGFGPGGATELFRRDDIAGQSEAPDELAGTFHVWQDLDFIT